MRYNNYHKHTHVSNIFTPDTHTKIEDYLKRAAELGHTTYFTTEHGTGGDIFDSLTRCAKAGLNCKFGIEAYIVSGEREKDDSNYHIIIIPRTNESRRELNVLTSRANREQFYRKPRLFTRDLLELNPNDFYITTACIAGILSCEDAIETVFNPLAAHFGRHLMAEVQAHWDYRQTELNALARDMAAKHRIRLIAATDSHYIYPSGYSDRIDFLNGKGIHLPEEGNFSLDYPDGDTLFTRFQKQGVLTDREIADAIESTLIFDDCEDIEISRDVKMPNIYPDLTPDERYQKLEQDVYTRFDSLCRKEGITGDERERRKLGLQDELKTIHDTIEINTQDYFLFNERMVDLAVNRYGGVLTRTGRGSGGAFYLNKILGMTQIDRFEAKIPLYPERFISTARLLEARSLPDFDFNVVSQEPFVQASRALLGERGCYPMLSYGTMQEGEAFRNVCRAKHLSFKEFNEAAKHVENKNLGGKWDAIRTEAGKYIDTIVNASVHPCSYLLMDGDIEREVGVVKIGEFLCAMITSGEADEYKYLKNDYLVVTVWEIISKTFAAIGKPILSVGELLRETRDDAATWSMYAKGLTSTLNQIDSEYATGLMVRYKAKTVEEVEMFVAALRPSFNAWRESFLSREPYTTGVPQLDELLSPTGGYMLFQENIMQFFGWLGIDAATSIGLIKKISKKKIKPEDFKALEKRLETAWIQNTGSVDMFWETWKDVQGVMEYGFNAPHAYATAIDSLYGAYLKSHYPLEYFTVVLNVYRDKMDKTGRLTDELRSFGIRSQPPRFGFASDEYMANAENRIITKGISSIKYMNRDAGIELYRLSKEREIPDFLGFLIENEKARILNRRQLEILVRLDFFLAFGNSATLLRILAMFDEFKNGTAQELSESAVEASAYRDIIKKHSDNHLKNGKLGKRWRIYDMPGLMQEAHGYILNLNLPERPLNLRIQDQQEFTGTVSIATGREEDRRKLFVTDIYPMESKTDGKVWGYAIFAQSIGSGKLSRWTLYSYKYEHEKVSKGDVIYIHSYHTKTKPDTVYYYIDEYWRVM